MSLISKILRNVEGGGLTFWCPGCNHAHSVNVGAGPGPRWGWNGDVHKPTFAPSILVRSAEYPEGDAAAEAEYDRISLQGAEALLASRFRSVCHSYVTDGVIDFLDDCTHALRGKHPIPDWPRPNYGGTTPAES